MKPASSRRGVLLALLAVGGAALIALFMLAPSVYEVEDKGKGPPIVPYEGSGLVYKVRVFDTFTVYGDSESRPNTDKLSSAGLVASATMALMTALLLGAVGSRARLRRFFGFAAGGLAFLAADELFAIHETVGHNLRFLADLPGVERPDDVVFLSYGLAVLVFAWLFRDILLQHVAAVRLFGVGAGFFVVAALGDIVGVGIDEPAEVASSLCLVAGLVLLTAETLRRELRLDRTRSARLVREPEPEAPPRVLSGAGRPG